MEGRSVELGVAASWLVEREAELDRLTRALDVVRGVPEAQLIVIEAPTGLGKTALLQATRTLAADREVRVLDAGADDHWAPRPFGVVEDLFEPLLAAPEHDRWFVGRAALAERLLRGSLRRETDARALCRSLWALCRGAAETCPLVVTVDDLHWADEPSLTVLHGVLRHAAHSRVLVVASTRPGAEGADERALAPVLADPGVEILRLRPLSVPAVEELVRQQGLDASPAVARMCHQVTDGNPFLLRQLLAEIEQSTGAVRGEDLEGLAPPRVSQFALARVAKLGERAVALTRAAAVLGDDVPLEIVASLAGMDRDEAASLADALVQASIFRRSLRSGFVHAIVRAAVLAALGPHERAELHRRAAELLAMAGEAPLRLARHLIRTDPAGDAQHARALCDAGKAAAARGALDDATAYLRRALAEPPHEDDWFEVLIELARVTVRLTPDAVSDVLDEAHRRARAPHELAAVALTRAHAALAHDRIPQAVQLLAQAADASRAAGDEQSAVGLDVELVSVARLDVNTRSTGLSRLRRLPRPQRCVTETDAVLLATAAVEESLTGGSIETTRELCRAALANDRILDHDEPAPGCGLAMAMAWCDELEEADALFARLQAAATERGVTRLLANATACRSNIALRTGDVEGAVALAQEALELMPPGDWGQRLALPVASLADALLEQGRPDAAAETLAEHGFASQGGRPLADMFVLDVRARLALARGDAQGARVDAEQCLGRVRAWQAGNPAMLQVHEAHVTALRLLGREDEALAALDDLAREVDRWPTRPCRATLLRLQAAFERDADAIASLKAADDLLLETQAVLERTRVLLALGAALRRAGARGRARDKLEEALVLAEGRSAGALAAAVEVELSALGVRRRADMEGRDRLTAGERRVVELALDGLNNRDIAQRLYLTVKTVEAHLTHSYRKLGISSRHELRHTLVDAPAGSGAAPGHDGHDELPTSLAGARPMP